VTTRYVDFNTGKELTADYVLPPAANATAALTKYAELCDLYADILIPGYWNFPPGDQIPEDLLLPFGEFVVKHDIVAALPRIFGVTGGGIGAREDFKKALTLYVMQIFGAPIARSFLGGVPLFAPLTNNMDLYVKIAASLGQDLLLESVVVDSERSDTGVKLVVQGKSGRKLIRAKRLLLAIQPTLGNLAPFDLDAQETTIFSKPKYGRGYTSIVTHSKLPDGTAIVNLPEAAVPSNYFAFIQPPFVTRFEHYGNGTKLYRLIVGSNDPDMNMCTAQNMAKSVFKKLADSGVVNAGDEKLRFVAISDHGATGYGVTAEELRGNFIRDMYALQGKRSTWYTGGNWAVDFTTILWAFNDDLLPRVIQGL
jgi:hypothetical protein